MRKIFTVAVLAIFLAACGAAAQEVYEIEEIYEVETAYEPYEPDEITYEEDEPEEIAEEAEEDDMEEVHYVPFEPIFTSEPLPDYIIALITGVSFREDTPFGFDALTYLTITHTDFNGESRIGHMIVAAEIGDEVLDIFREIYAARFPIYQMRLIDHFNADDKLSLDANNSSAFNFRYIAGTNVISRHGFGLAIDINPIQNPYIRGETILPPAGAAYLDRDDIRPGMIVPGCPVHHAFTSRGWIWGGDWTTLRDYHHFERRNP